MSSSADPDLIKVTEIFLVPSSFLVAAVGTADTNAHRAMISLLGLIISVLWWFCCQDAIAESPSEQPRKRRTRILTWLSVVFIVGWLGSAIVHAMLWSLPLGG